MCTDTHCGSVDWCKHSKEQFVIRSMEHKTRHTAISSLGISFREILTCPLKNIRVLLGYNLRLIRPVLTLSHKIMERVQCQCDRDTTASDGRAYRSEAVVLGVTLIVCGRQQAVVFAIKARRRLPVIEGVDWGWLIGYQGNQQRNTPPLLFDKLSLQRQFSSKHWNNHQLGSGVNIQAFTDQAL